MGIFKLISVSFLLFLFGCKVQNSSLSTLTPQVGLNLQILASYDAVPLVMYKTYLFNGKPIQFTRFSFILSKLCSANGVDCNMRQTQFDFATVTDSLSALKGLTNNISVDPTNLQNFKIGLGVDSSSNQIPPALQNPNSPLSNGLNYWDAWNSYIFLKIEGKYDKDGDGIFETPFALHTGGNLAYTEQIYSNFSVSGNGQSSSIAALFSVDLAKVMSGIDLNVTTQTHKSGDEPTMIMIMNNFKNALVYKPVAK